MPDFIKCDVEGAELDVFRGARTILDTPNAPVILFEANVYTAGGFNPPISAAKDFLLSLAAPAYSFFRLDASSGAMTEVRDLDPVHSNVLAVPRVSLNRL